MEISILTPEHKFAAASLFALALHQSQLNQTRLLKNFVLFEDTVIDENASNDESVSVTDNPQLWIHEASDLLFPVCRYDKFSVTVPSSGVLELGQCL